MPWSHCVLTMVMCVAGQVTNQEHTLNGREGAQALWGAPIREAAVIIYLQFFG